MSQRRVIAWKFLPVRLPFYSTVTAALALDVWGAPAWLWGVVATLFGLLWIAAFVMIYQQELVPPSKVEAP